MKSDIAKVVIHLRDGTVLTINEGFVHEVSLPSRKDIVNGSEFTQMVMSYAGSMNFGVGEIGGDDRMEKAG